LNGKVPGKAGKQVSVVITGNECSNYCGSNNRPTKVFCFLRWTNWLGRLAKMPLERAKPKSSIK
jgi:hypothetical protein